MNAPMPPAGPSGAAVRPVSAPPAPTRSRGTAGGPPVAPTGAVERSAATGADLLATGVLVALTLVSTLGYLRVFSSHDWIPPVLATALGTHAVMWATRRLRLGLAVSVLVGLVAAALLVGWTVLGADTWYGVPDGATWSHFIRALDAAGGEFRSAIAPVPVTMSFSLLMTMGAGVVALLGDLLAFRLRSALLGASPGFAGFVVACTLGTGAGRQMIVTAEAAALVGFLLVDYAASVDAIPAWFGRRRDGVVSSLVVAGSISAAAAILVAVVVTPALGNGEGRGAFGWKTGLGDDGPGPREVANPVVDLRTRLLDPSTTPVFTVQTSVPSYWRLTSLDTFTGTDWVSTNSYQGFGSRLPGAQAVPPATRTVTARFHVENLDSVWLPASFTPVSVQGVRDVGYDPTSGSLITSKKTSDGLTYTVTSYQYLSSLNPKTLNAAPALHLNSSLARYVALPTGIPPSVYDLARAIIAQAHAHTEYAKALALQEFFAGPDSKFTYSLDPPSDGYGTDALVNFLFNTKEGYCQQFAGAYAVLARAVGLPTRLAVGFSTGTATGDTYQVADSDAHTWPEVYFGPQLGWLPFEPTKSFTDPSISSYLPAATGSSSASSPFVDPIAPAPKGDGGFAAGLINPGIGGAAAGEASPPAPAPAPVVHHDSQVGPDIGLALAALIVWVLLNAGFRRARWTARRLRAGPSSSARVLGYWTDVTEMLEWWGVRREPGETLDEMAARAAARVGGRLRDPSPWIPRGIVRLAHLATEAAYAKTVSPARVAEARQIAREVRQGLFRNASGRQLFVWGVLPRPGVRLSPWTSVGRGPVTVQAFR